jgi:hypothetical protein
MLFIGCFKLFKNVCGRVGTLLRLSHGENRGSSPLGSANHFNDLDCRRVRQAGDEVLLHHTARSVSTKAGST